MRRARRGGIYFAVIGVSMLISIIGMGAMAAARAQRLAASMATDAVRARELARSAVELGVEYVAADSAWRSSRPNGAWITGKSLGTGTIAIHGTDPTDGDLANRLTDPLTIRGVGSSGRATQLLEVDLVASGEPIDALKYAVHTAGQISVGSSKTLHVSGGAASTNGNLKNDGVINGNVEALTTIPLGTVNGTVTISAVARSMPDSGVLAMYQNLGTPINPPTTIQNVLLSPTSNPWGAPDPDGVYVITTNSDLTIRNMRVYGTLVIVNGTNTVRFDQPVHVEPARADYPAMIVQGNIEFAFKRTEVLSESATGVNFNPPGAPFNGAVNLNMTDSFPAEIVGLVHARGGVSFTQDARVRGCVISESAGAEAIDISAAPEILYAPSLQAQPIMGYMKAVNMRIAPGSWRQVVLP